MKRSFLQLAVILGFSWLLANAAFGAETRYLVLGGTEGSGSRAFTRELVRLWTLPGAIKDKDFVYAHVYCCNAIFIVILSILIDTYMTSMLT